MIGGNYSVEQLSAGNYTNLMTANEEVKKVSDKPTGDKARLDAKRNRDTFVNNQLAFIDMMKDAGIGSVVSTNKQPLPAENLSGVVLKDGYEEPVNKIPGSIVH